MALLIVINAIPEGDEWFPGGLPPEILGEMCEGYFRSAVASPPPVGGQAD